MKKIFFALIPIIIIAIGCAGGAKTGSGGMTLDQAIKEAAIQIDQEIAAGIKIALLNFTSPAEGFSSYVLDELTANLVGTKKLTVVDRKEMDLIRSESNFQLSGEVSDDSMQAIGQKLGAQSIVSGSLQDVGGSYRIVIRVLNVESAAVAVQYRNDIANDNRVKALLAGGKSGGTATAGGTSGGGQTATATAPKNGTYIFFPRPRSMRGGVDEDWYLDKIVVRGGYFSVYMTTAARGDGRAFNPPWNATYKAASIKLQDLDRPSRVYSAARGENINTHIIYSYQNVNGKRFSLSYEGDKQPYPTFEEFNLDNAEYEP